MSIAENYLKIRREIPDTVTIVLAGKTRTPQEILEAVEAGATDIGHNYVQEAEQMCRDLGEQANRITRHMIGPLQTNKINKALHLFDVIQTVDSLEKARAISLRAEKAGKTMPVYIEINIGNEAAKSGVAPDMGTLEVLVAEMAKLKHMQVTGLMTMGPLTGDPEDSRPHFRKTRQLFESLQTLAVPGITMETLSMGMSDSYRVAIEEGATMVRLGTVVFGARSYNR